MKISHVIVAILFFLLGAACVLGYVHYSNFCLGDKPLVGVITEPRDVAAAPVPAPAAEKPVAPKMTTFRIEKGINRHGSDYRQFAAEADAKYEVCQKACEEDAKCLAFTYVKAGIQGATPQCWLKNSVPQAYPDDTCISGVKE